MRFFPPPRKTVRTPASPPVSLILDTPEGTLHFSVVYARRRTSCITVRRDGEVVVRVPLGTGLERIKSLVGDKAGWIFRKRQYFRETCPPPFRPSYREGETHFYLGLPYTLRIKAGAREGVEREGTELVVAVRTPERTEAVLNAWYRERAKEEFARLAAPLVREFQSRHGLAPRLVSVRRMKRRWGSCSTAGHVLLNTELVRAPEDCVAYVIVHELCHLVHPNHSKSFYELLSRECPGWKERKAKLERTLY